ncbi:MAG: class I SAM-dependent methyltransferase [Planctomycetota bacterium]
MLRGLLAHPLTRGLDLDDPATTRLRRRIIREKPFLRAIYDEWYGTLARQLPGEGDVPGWALELGSGAGYLDEVVPRLITSDVFTCPGLKLVADARRMPLPDASLRGVAMVDVLHHVPGVEEFFSEAARVVKVGGTVAMIEPWVSRWSTWVYQNLHHEPFRPDAADWSIPAAGPLSGANGALPWLVFVRDRARFEDEFRGWRVETLRPLMPLRYLVSGGVSMRSLAPGWSTPLWRLADAAAGLGRGRNAMFVNIVLRRAAGPG